MKRAISSLIAPTLMLIGCGDSATSPKSLPLDIKQNSTQHANQIQQAADLLIAACPNIATQGVEQVTAEVHTDAWDRIDGKAYLPEFLSRGWDRAIEFTFKHPVNQGQCFIKAGGGLQPGLEVTPSRCFDICNGTQSINDARFQVIQAAGTETNDPINKYQKRWREEIQKISNKASQGDYQAQRNIAYLLENAPPNENHAIQACAGRVKVANHKKAQSDDVDVNQAKRACAKLTAEQQAKALDFINVFKLPD